MNEEYLVIAGYTLREEGCAAAGANVCMNGLRGTQVAQ